MSVEIVRVGATVDRLGEGLPWEIALKPSTGATRWRGVSTGWIGRAARIAKF
jgi:hypothetical protein